MLGSQFVMIDVQVVSLPDRQSHVGAKGLHPYPDAPMGTWINTIAHERKLYCNMPDRHELHTPEFLVATLTSALLGRHGFGNAQYETIVHDILEKNSYVITPDYMMKMLHIEVPALASPCCKDERARISSFGVLYSFTVWQVY